MKLVEGLKQRATILKKELLALWYASKDPRVPLLPKLIMLVALGYALSPIDLIPDFIPVLGYLDDLILIPALIALSLKLVPKEVMEAARVRADTESTTLEKRPLFAVLFVAIWILIALVLLRWVLGFFR